jgi:hypothetical protein
LAAQSAPPIRLPSLRGVPRVELVFGGVDQAGPSFEGRDFLNNPDADESTAQIPATGYAGSFHVYGYGDPAPPEIAEAKARRPEGGGPVAPIEKRLKPDEAAVRAALQGSNELIITVVPVPAERRQAPPYRPFERVEVVFNPAATQQYGHPATS